MEGARFLLDTYVDTLDTLRIYPFSWSGEEHSPVPVHVRLAKQKPTVAYVGTSTCRKNRSLRSLETTVRYIAGYSPSCALGFFKDLLCGTIASSVFSDVVLILQGDLVTVVRGMYEMKPFRLVFCLEVQEGHREHITERLKRC